MVIEAIPRSVGFIYGLVMVCIVAWLWYSGRWKQKTGWLLLGIAAVMGFVIFSPVMPYQFEQLVLGNTVALEGPVIVGAIGITVTLVLSLLFGRFFCGYICPAGAVQEIAYHAPVRKTPLHHKTAFMIIRAVFVLLFLALVLVLSLSILSFFGIRDFFYLTLSAGAGVFLVILLIATTFYRPFCRFFCPVGFLFSLIAWKSVFGLRRTDACINCKKCEKVCPVAEAGRNDRKAECYLCGRCVEICPKNAIRYGRDSLKERSQKEA
jgi:polyferredoxin